MAKVYAMIADGTEEVECHAVVDILRRSGVEFVLLSVGSTKEKTDCGNLCGAWSCAGTSWIFKGEDRYLFSWV